MCLIAVTQTLEYLHGLLDAGFAHKNRLEATLKGGILLDVFAILVESGRPDGLQFPSGERRLDDAGRVDRTLCGSGTDKCVHLVNEQDDVSPLTNLLHDLLESILELTPVLATRHERSEVQSVKLLVLDRFRHLVGSDELCQALRNGGLAHSRLTYEYGIVLGAPGQDLHDALDLLRAADHRVELSIRCLTRQIASELIQNGSVATTAAFVAPLFRLLAVMTREKLYDCGANLLKIGTEIEKHLRSNTLALTDEAEQDMLRAYVVVPQLQSLAKRELEHLLRARSEGDVASRHECSSADKLLDLGMDILERDIERLERLGGDTVLLADQTEQEMLGSDVVLIKQPRLFLGVHDNPAGLLGEAFEHLCSTSRFQENQRS